MSFFQPEGCLIHTESNREALATPAGLERAMREGRILEGVVTLCDAALSLHLELGCAHGVIPHEEAVFCREGERIKDIAVITRVGKPVSFVIQSLEMRDGQLWAILSRRLAQKCCFERFLSYLRPGDLIPARVTHLESFGAFVDIGCGVASLLSVDCISVSRIAHPRDRLTPGDLIRTVVKTVDRESGRIYVSMRELLGTWRENAALFTVGQTVRGIIRSTETYGIFVELTPNLAGLAELREDATEQDAARLIPGRQAAVYIKNIVPDRMKIKLVLIDIGEATSPSAPPPIRYFITPEKVGHIDRWIYSPPTCGRLIETVFE